MTNLLELLKNEKVEWKKLGKVGEILSGLKGMTAEDFKNGTAKFIPYISVFNNYEITNNSIFSTVRINDKSKQNEVRLGDVLFTASSENKEDAGMTSVITEQLKESTYLNSFCFIYRFYDDINILPEYSKHIFRSLKLRKEISKTAQGVTRFNISKERIFNIEIPIPSLEIQEKIVEILDKFTNYVTELQSELQSRTKQYTYYRDMLLSEEYLNKITKEMEEDRRLSKVKLEEVVTIKNGKDWKKLGKGDIPVYGSGGEMGVYVDKYSYDKPTVLIPRKGSIENVFYLDKPFWNVDTIFHTEIDESKLIPKYFYYFIEQYDLSKLSDNPTRPSLTQSTLNKLIIDIPPLSLQNKIVKVLDKFQLLLEDTKGLLPEEIEQRQKQYEYYREKLLTFDIDSDSTHARTVIISNLYYDILYKAAELVGVDIKDKVNMKKITDFCNRQKGINITAKQMKELNIENGEVKVFAGGSTVAYLDIKEIGEEQIIDKPSIIVKSRGNIDFEFYDKKFTHKNEMWSYSVNDDNNIRYVFYYLKNNVDYFKSRAISGKLPQISTGVTDSFNVPLPPLHVQHHIVSILDKFDTLVNDIKEGLPKEIEQRQKQYEYWREQLLSFSK